MIDHYDLSEWVGLQATRKFFAEIKDKLEYEILSTPVYFDSIERTALNAARLSGYSELLKDCEEKLNQWEQGE